MSTRRAALVGALAALFWLGGLAATTPLSGDFPLVVVADALVRATPGDLATTAIETFGKGALPLLVAGVAAGTVAVGAVLGVLWARAPPALAARPLLPALGLAAVTAFLLDAAGVRWVLPLLGGTAVAVLPPLLFARSRPFLDPYPTRDLSLRRRVITGLVAAAGLVAVATPLARLLGVADRFEGAQPGSSFDPDLKRRLGNVTPASDGDRSTSQINDSTEPFAFDFWGMPSAVTPTADHYVVDAATSDPRVDTDDYTLDVRGFVDERLSYSYDELLADDAVVTRPVTMVCISNTVGGRLVSTAYWHGIPLSDLLDRAGVREDAVDVVTRAADGYHEAIPLDVARREDILLAFGMNGRRLPVSHGFPVRLLIPGRYGMKSTKWVTDVNVVDREHEAFWERRGWDEEAVVNTLSYLRGAERRNDRVAVGGVAYAGLRGVQRVEVSVDGGDTFHDAELEDPVGPLTWHRFQYVFEKPDSGTFEAVVRATDGEGTRQTSTRTPPHPGGSTGWHSQTFEL